MTVLALSILLVGGWGRRRSYSASIHAWAILAGNIFFDDHAGGGFGEGLFCEAVFEV